MMFYRKESFKDFVNRYPVLSVIIALNALIFIYMWLRIGISDSYLIVYFGGIVPETIIYGEYWRFFTYAFLHGSVMHIIMNMFFLIIIAPPLEVIIGRVRMVQLFLFSVFTTAFFVFIIGSQYGVGASGFAYGILGLYIYIVVNHKGFIDHDSRKIVLVWTVIGWIATLIIPNISFYGHLGGFVGGYVYGYLSVRDRTRLTPWS